MKAIPKASPVEVIQWVDDAEFQAFVIEHGGSFEWIDDSEMGLEFNHSTGVISRGGWLVFCDSPPWIYTNERFHEHYELIGVQDA